MLYAGVYNDLTKALTYLTIVLSIVSCNSNEGDGFDEMAALYPAPHIVTSNNQNESTFNLRTGDSIHPGITSIWDTIKIGVPISVRGKVIDPKSVAKPRVIFAGKPKVVSAHLNVHKIPETLTVIPVNKDSLKTFTLGDIGPRGLPTPVKGRVIPCKEPEPVKALPARMRDNAITNLKYLDVGQGMNFSNITSTFEDRHGNIWFCTDGRGVSMYDGEFFTHFTSKEGLSHNYVLSGLEDRHGNLWFCTYGGGVNMYDGETFTNFTGSDGLGHSVVWTVFEDSKGNLWFGTNGAGASMYDGKTFTSFTKREGMSHGVVRCIFEDSRGNIWFGTEAGGVSMYNGKTFTYFTQKEGLINDRILSIMEDSKGNLWFGFGSFDGGVCKYNGKSFTHYTQKEGLSDNSVSSILEGSNGNIWFGTRHGGVSMYNGETFTHITEKEGLSDNSVRSIFEDSKGNLWFGTRDRGVSIYLGETFSFFTENEGLCGSDIISILEDSRGNMWFGTRGTGVCMYNGQSFTHFTQNEGLLANVVKSILEDSHGNIWFACGEKGVSMYKGNTFTHFTVNEGLSHNRVLSIMEDSHSNIWFGTWNRGLNMYNGETFTHFTIGEGLYGYRVRAIMEDSHGNIWFSYGYGGVVMYNGKIFTHINQRDGLRGVIISMLEDSHGNLWFGSRGEGVSMYNGKTFKYFTEKEGLSDNTITSILEDNENNIWIGTHKGLNCLAFEKDCVSSLNKSLSSYNSVVHNYSLQDGMKGIYFNETSALLDSRNHIWWGNSNCLTMLDMSNFMIPIKPPVIQLIRLDINGQFANYRSLEDSDGIDIEFDSVARLHMYPLNPKLPHNLNHLTFHYSTMDRSAPHKIRYSYKMEGLDDNWNAPTAETKADYRNIPHGKYIFKVMAIGAAQKWSETIEYPFTINPPLWFTWWAYMIYGFILLLLIRWYRGFLIKREKINADLRIKEVEVNKMQELDHMKSRFFANISHEFRTPLTLIQGPIEELRRDLPDLSVEKIREILQFVRRNTSRLLDLINQILDISKLETGKVKLYVSEGDLLQFARTIIQSFLSLAESRKIEYTFDLQETPDIVFFDSDKLEKILTNLISNAFKFTNEGGDVQVSLKFLTGAIQTAHEYVKLEVADTGKGIPLEDVDRIFDRFYQVSDTDLHDAKGAGLGLALTKELVDIYRGEITVDSQEGKGSTFTVKLPVSINLFTKEEIVPSLDSQDRKPESIDLVHDHEVYECNDAEGNPVQTQKADKPVLLIVEDNEDLRNYLSRNLENNYHILKAINGTIGLDMAFQCIPDLIISDLMMPEMDGMEMIQQLKSSEITNHIPVIILTAKTDRESKLGGLEKGIDDYMIKPFDAEELQVRVNNLIQQRQKLRNRYRREFLSEFDGPDIPTPENDFLVRVIDCINKHITESEFNVAQLGIELGFSRQQLYRKILALTDHTPNEFIRNIRLKMAAKMFHQGQRNIARVLYSVGFNTPAYFAQCFREVYGINPSEYIKKIALAE